ncbi:MAG: hypothetical protein H0X01_02275 [Nitrospira sp.]|nr:hypothetical protein [Nitrospira sp.]
MAVNVLKLKKEAVALGMDKAAARTADRSVLEAYIAKAGTKTKAPAKKKVVAAAPRKAVARKATPAPAKAKKATPAKVKAAPVKAKTSARVKATPAAKVFTKTEGKVKRVATNGNGNGGRNLLGSLDFSATDGWNPRTGSPVDVIFKALKRSKGSVDKAFEALLPEIKQYVSSKKPDGTKRNKEDMHKLLRYRINRTRFQFALQTGQHKSSTDRVQYGTGSYATTRKRKPARAARPTRKAAAPKAKAGRKPATKR